MRQNRAFSLIELMVVITIMATLISISLPVYNGVITRTKMTKGMAHVDQIVKGCKLYSLDWESYPTFDTRSDDGAEFGTSTEAFQELSRELDLGVEGIFWTAGNPDKLRPPNEDGELVAEEVSFSYVKAQGPQTDARSPLVADEMESPGVYGENHPWLSVGKAVVGYCGGQVKQERLTEKAAGASVRGPVGSGIDDIFARGTKDENGKISGGYLAVDEDNILLPE